MKFRFETLLFTALLSLQACGSPLMNHTTAEKNSPDISANNGGTQNTLDCPLYFAQDGLCGSLTWDKLPVEGQSSSFLLKFWQKQGGTFNGPYAAPPYSITVKLWMPAMGHGSAPVTLTPAADSHGVAVPGVYTGSNAYFIMTGNWEVHIQFKVGSATHEDVVISIRI